MWFCQGAAGGDCGTCTMTCPRTSGYGGQVYDNSVLDALISELEDEEETPEKRRARLVDRARAWKREFSRKRVHPVPAAALVRPLVQMRVVGMNHRLFG